MPLPLAALVPLLGRTPTDAAIDSTLSALGTVEFDEKKYPDATYRNYYALGLSLCFTPSGSALELDSIDIFNPTAEPPRRPTKAGAAAKPEYAQPPSPLVVLFADPELVFPPRKAGETELRVARPPLFEITETTKGRDIVKRLGEPSRKGAGGWVGVWLEWAAVRLKNGEETVTAGVMLELKDPKGAEEVNAQQQKEGMGGIWDRAAFWRWGSVKLFRSKSD